ncbi:phage holin family protein [Paucisalibacillus globulus]|uniref:phage holin family protein n=1 Tax=Paucisalibacillus globulus TaxID=351095 RepID=UPI00056B0741|nr:phage holin family protein [Paucisalibacillus globulus]
MLTEYVVLVVVAICLAIGFVVKNSLDIIQNKYIPLIMAVLGVLLNVWLNTGAFTPEILLGGLASGLASTGAFELIKNTRKDVE